MENYYPFIAILAMYLVLFICSGGLFRRSARFLRGHLPTLSAYAAEETVRTALLIIFAADLLGAALQYQTKTEDTAAKGYLTRGEYGAADDTAELALTVGGEQHEVELQVSSRKMSPAETEALLADAASRLPDLVLQGMPADRVSRDVVLPEKIEGLPVKVSWMTDRPDLLDWDGVLQEGVPEEGAPVTLTAEITFEEETRECGIPLTVYPKERSAEETFLGNVRSEIARQNDATEERVSLPETIDGMDASWETRSGNAGASILFIGILAAVLFVYSRVRVKEIAREKRTEQMRLEYPNIVNKLVLLTSAGMSLRQAFARIRDDYRKSLAERGEVRPGSEEIVRTSLEMEHGVAEFEAYRNLGRRCAAREYKTFATLLSQSVTRGGSELGEILRREAAEAVEERKKRARVLGEEAGTKLLLPMLLMLLVVMAVLMVPALVAFV